MILGRKKRLHVCDGDLLIWLLFYRRDDVDLVEALAAFVTE